MNMIMVYLARVKIIRNCSLYFLLLLYPLGSERLHQRNNEVIAYPLTELWKD